MKRLFKNVNAFGLLGMLVMGLLVFTQSAFKSDSHRAEGEYFFNGTDASQIQDANVWGTTLDMNLYRCVTTAPLPCKITVPQDETLADYLVSHEPSEIITLADSKRTDAP